MDKNVRNRSVEARNKARVLRSGMSVSERYFWMAVRKNRIGFRCKRQVPVGPYVLDFYFPEASLCVEVDGEQHQDRIALDRRRDQFLNERGILTIRIPSLDLFDPTGVPFSRWVARVAETCEERAA